MKERPSDRFDSDRSGSELCVDVHSFGAGMSGTLAVSSEDSVTGIGLRDTRRTGRAGTLLVVVWPFSVGSVVSAGMNR